MKKTDLHAFARMNRVDELRAAIINGVNINEKDSFGATALHYAISEKNSDAILVLLENGANVSAQDGDGKTPLHYAAEYNLTHVAEELLKNNPAVIAIADKFGNQPLWTAAFNAKGNYELVSLLLRYGADAEHQNNAKLSPLDIPKRKRDVALQQILESKNPK